jgi:hypothetical protein
MMSVTISPGSRIVSRVGELISGSMPKILPAFKGGVALSTPH